VSLCARLPVPQPAWHPYVPMILRCREDFEYALALAAERPEVIVRAAALVEEEGEPALGPSAPRELAAARTPPRAARRRLPAPLPQRDRRGGAHPARRPEPGRRRLMEDAVLSFHLLAEIALLALSRFVAATL
jgi:hypothetical protein